MVLYIPFPFFLLFLAFAASISAVNGMPFYLAKVGQPGERQKPLHDSMTVFAAAFHRLHTIWVFCENSDGISWLILLRSLRNTYK